MITFLNIVLLCYVYIYTHSSERSHGILYSEENKLWNSRCLVIPFMQCDMCVELSGGMGAKMLEVITAGLWDFYEFYFILFLFLLFNLLL